MRKHKPTIRYGDQVFSSSNTATDNYNIQDDYSSLQPSTSRPHYGTYNNFPYSSTENYFHMKYPRPAYRAMAKNGPIRGIRTKFVQKRNDFMSNNGISSRPVPHQRQMPLGCGANDDDAENDDDTLIIPELMPTFIKNEPMMEDEGSIMDPMVKAEPMENAEDMTPSEASVCFICNEKFATSHEYNLHAMFVHNIN